MVFGKQCRFSFDAAYIAKKYARTSRRKSGDASPLAADSPDRRLFHLCHGENKLKLYDYTYEQIQALLLAWNEPAFRAKQIFAWCAKGAPIEQMHNIPKALRQKLASLGLDGMRIEQTHRSADGTKKFLFRCEDGNAVEGVLMKNHHGGTLCISTQAGCRMGCAFCASTQLGLARNLTIGELCGQLYAVRRQEGEDSFTTSY